MWITETVELPDELIDAARKDELVLFVGAGASIDPPASLPSYKELVTELAREQLPDEEAVQQLLDGSSLDDVLGKLPDRENAHSRALRLMQPNESHCNETHKAIMRLAKAVGTPRIVTTNYDMLLEEAGKNLEIDFGRVYAGPALPLGSSFDGIVHVHGNLQSRPDEIILDNHDYAKAYLQDSWAARFITEMFRHYSVLFIGYGMTDPIMKYLTLGGISQNHPHFVLIGEKIAQGDSNVDDNGWIERGITPIQFPLHEDPEPRFKELPIVLNRFAKSLSDDYIEIKERIQRIIDSGNVPSSLDDSDFMTMALRTEDGAKCFMNFFARFDNDEASRWLSWMLNNSKLSHLFTDSQEPSEGESFLGRRILDYTTMEKHQSVLCSLLVQLQNNIGDWLFSQCFTSLFLALEHKERWACKPLSILLTQNPEKHIKIRYSAYIHLENLLAAGMPSRLLSRIIYPIAKYAVPGSINSNPDVSWSLQIYDRRKDTVIPNDSILLSNGIIDFAEESLKQQNVYRVINGLGRFYTYMGRPAIEIHEQNRRFDKTTSFFIEILREYATHHADHPERFIWRWWQSNTTLLQRLAIFAVNASGWSSDKKIKWIIDQRIILGFTSQLDLWHETLTLLRKSIEGASAGIRNELIQQIKDIGNTDDPKTSAARQHGILDWMLRGIQDNSWKEALELKESIERESGLSPQSHPDFCTWHGSDDDFSSGLVDNATFLSLLQNDPEQLISLLMPIKDIPFGLNHTIQYQIPQLVEDDYRVGMNLWKIVRDSGRPANIILTIQQEILSGWVRCKPENIELQRIFGLIDELSDQSKTSVINTVVQFITRQVEDADRQIPEEDLHWTDSVAQQVWNEQREQYVFRNHEEWKHDPITPTRNNWPGELAWYWIHRIQWRKTHEIKKWAGLNETELNILDQFSEATGDLALMVRPPLLSNVNRLHDLDSKATEKIVSRILRTESPIRVWQVLLYSGTRPNLRLMRFFFFKKFIEVFKSFDDCGDSLKRQVIWTALGILDAPDFTDAERDEITHAIVSERHQEAGVIFGKEIAQLCWRNSQEDAQWNCDATWDLWLKKYVKSRSDNKGPAWSNKERVQFSFLIPLLGNHVSEAREILGDLPDYSDAEQWQLNQMFTCNIPIDDMDEGNRESLMAFYTEVIRQNDVRQRLSQNTVAQMLAQMETVGGAGYQSLLQSAKALDLFSDGYVSPPGVSSSSRKQQ